MDIGNNEVEIPVDHRLLFPYGTVICGRAFPHTCEVLFKHCVNSKGNITLDIEQLTSKDENGVVYDLEYLTKDLTTPVGNHIILCILGNEEYWDWEPKKGEEPTWW